jgi:NAD(P)-dependent dehydrogenase (short-subunit alcohol dehydrogenase family)
MSSYQGRQAQYRNMHLVSHCVDIRTLHKDLHFSENKPNYFTIAKMARLEVYIAFYTSLLKSLFSLVFARLYISQRPSRRDLTSQIAVITGANSGIGLSIATQLVMQGATVYLACRSLDRGERAVDEIVSKVGEKSVGKVHCWKLDTSDLASVRAFCARWTQQGTKIDMLIHNAGIASPPPNTPSTTEDGKDLVYVTNFLGSFLMTQLLDSNLTSDARVVLTSSTGHYSATYILQPPALTTESTPFQALKSSVYRNLNLTSSAPAYAYSKAAQVLFAHQLQRHFAGTMRSAHSFTPGFTSSAIFSKFDVSWRTWLANPLFATLKATERWVAVDTDEGSRTGSWLAAGEAAEGGGFWEWGVKRTSLIDFLRGRMGEERFRERAGKEWKMWETDCGVTWDVED